MDIFTDRRSGLKFCMKMGNPTADDILKNGIYEYPLIDWCKQFVKSDGIFIDVGAHMGTYSMILAPHCEEVHSFEAQKSTHEGLCTGICANDRYNITTHNVALGSCEGEATLHQVSPDGGGSTLSADIAQQNTILATETVKVVTLDSFDLQKVCFMKIDVEGHELEVLKGARRTLLRNGFPPFIFEAWPDSWYKEQKEELIEFVEDLGYIVHPISGYSNMFLASDHILTKEEHKKEDNSKLIKAYELGSKDFTWKEWYKLACYHRSKGINDKAVECAKSGLECNVPEDEKFRFYEELSISAFYIQEKILGYQACDKIIFDKEAPWDAKNKAVETQSYYINRLPFKRITNLVCDLPVDFLPSSSSVIRKDDKLLINVRAVNYSINHDGGYTMRHPQNYVVTRNFLCELDPEKYTVVSCQELENKSNLTKYPYHIQGLEDIRLATDHDLLCTCLEYNDKGIPQICYASYDSKSSIIERILPLKIGDELKCEKNWLPFEDQETLKFIYSFQPLRIYSLNRQSGEISLITETEIREESLDLFRGSAPLIPYKNGWLGTIHQVFDSRPRKYLHRFVWFDENFLSLKFSKTFFFEAPQIEYNVSICHSSQGLIVPYSIKDNCCKIGLLSYEILDAMLFS